MGAKVPFTKQEAVLLLFYLLEALTGKMRRTEAIARCSADLRRMARTQGMDIAPDYRSPMGIRGRMNDMESAYHGNTEHATRIFIETVALYQQDRAEYRRILQEARDMAKESATLPQKEEMPRPSAATEGRNTLAHKIEELVRTAGIGGLSAAELAARLQGTVTAVKREAKKNIRLVELKERFVHRDAFSDYEEGATGLSKILVKLLEKNTGYTSAPQLYDYARGELPVFLDDNDLHDVRKVYDLAEHLFSKECFDGTRYHFQRKQYISLSDDGIGNRLDLLQKYAEGEDGLLRKADVDDYFARIGMTPPSLYDELSPKSRIPLVLRETGVFLTAQSMGMDEEWQGKMQGALQKLFDDSGDHVVLRRIEPRWYELLPPLPHNLPWTPLLLQSLLMQYGSSLGVRVIRALPNQWPDTLAAMLVSEESEIETFPEAILVILMEEGIEEREFSAEALRQLLVGWGMIGEWELRGNLPKATAEDRRFAWDRKKSQVTIRF